MWVFLSVLVFWSAVLFGGQALFKSWRRRRFLQPAHSLKEIGSVAYYRQISQTQFESLVLQGMRARDYTFLGDPWLGRSKNQGYAWKKGKKVVFSYRRSRALNRTQLNEIAKKLRLVRAETVLVFSPLRKFPRTSPAGVEIVAGKKLLRWFSILDTAVPPIANKLPAEKCTCGAPMKERVSRAGLPLLVCSMFPDCREVRRPPESPPSPPRASLTSHAQLA